MSNTNFQTFHQMGNAVNDVIRQATGRRPVENIDMDYVTVAQNTVVGELEFSGDVVSFNTGRSVPIRKLEVSIEPVQTGTGDPTPENVRPISGWTGCNVSRTGKNLFDQSQLLRARDWSIDNNGFYFGTRKTFNTAFNLGFPILPKFKENTQYTLSFVGYNDSSISNTYIRFTYTDETTTTIAFDATTPTEYSITSASGKTLSNISGSYFSSGDINIYIKNMMLVENSTATDYEPYTGETITTEFPTPPGTVYGGTLDVITGVLTVDRVVVTFDGTETYLDNYFPVIVCSKVLDIVGDYNKQSQMISNVCTSSNISFATSQAKNIQFRNARTFWGVSSADEFKQLAEDLYNNGTPITIIYPIATPQTYQLTPQEVSTLVGDNNIYADTGSVDVMYYVYREMI